MNMKSPKASYTFPTTQAKGKLKLKVNLDLIIDITLSIVFFAELVALYLFVFDVFQKFN